MVRLFSFIRYWPNLTVVVPFWIPTSCESESCYSTSLLVCGIVCGLNFGHFNWCLVLSGINLQFPNDTWCWVSFHVLISHLYILLGKMSVVVFSPFLSWAFTYFCRYYYVLYGGLETEPRLFILSYIPSLVNMFLFFKQDLFKLPRLESYL